MRGEGRAGMQVLIAANSALRRQELQDLIASQPLMTNAGSLPVSSDMERRLRELAPDVVLIDGSGVPSRAFERLLAHLAGRIQLVLLSEDSDPRWMARMMRLGLGAMIHPDASAEQIFAAIHAAHAGLVSLDPDHAKSLAQSVPRSAEIPEAELEELTPREREVLTALADGLGNKEIAVLMRISEHTVKFHVSSILSKTGASSRTEAVTLGIRKGWILL